MSRSDLHVHSMFSDRPSEWFLQKLGSAESYTSPEKIYRTAKERGMDFVTITDHNEIEASLILKTKYPNDVFTGVESTTYFPEDGCKAHILIYGLNAKQFEEIESIRKNIYEFRDYLLREDLTHSLAHATFSVNGKINITHLEKFILLFDIFEVRNGGINKSNNEIWEQALLSLTPEKIEELSDKYNIEPASDTPWLKGFTGGSDDHAGLFIGRTYTENSAKTPEEFLKHIREKGTIAGGRHSDFRSFAFSAYKIVYDFAKSGTDNLSKTFISQISDLVFENKSLSIKNRLKLKLRKLSGKKRHRNERIYNILYRLIDEMKSMKKAPLEDKLDIVYDRISDIVDEFLTTVVESSAKSIKKGDIVGLVKNISAAIPPVFLSAPFFTTLKHMFGERALLDEIERRFLPNEGRKEKRVLWFSDTFADLNGVSVTLNKIARLAHEKNKELKMVSILTEEEKIETPPNFVNLPSIYNFKLPYYEKLTIKIPSILKSIKMLYEFNPDEVYLSSPAPIGILGLTIAKLLSSKSIGVYHTDFYVQAKQIIGEDTVASIPALIEQGTKLFYSFCDEVSVPTAEYMGILEKRGFDINKMSLFKRGIEPPEIISKKKSEEVLEKYGIKNGFTLMYAGRVSKDKNLDFLLKVYQEVKEKESKVNLLIVGDGPYLEEMKSLCKKEKRVYFTGRLDNKQLPPLYFGSNLFVFPSTTDTFGMVVLEAQACTLPAIVSEIGGPREIVEDGKTGFVLNTEEKESVKEWKNKILSLISMSKETEDYMAMRNLSRKTILDRFNWNNVITSIFSMKGRVELEPVLEKKSSNKRETQKAV